MRPLFYAFTYGLIDFDSFMLKDFYFQTSSRYYSLRSEFWIKNQVAGYELFLKTGRNLGV